MISCFTILIPTHGRATLLGRTLASLAECSIPEGYVETVVIENGPKSGAEDTVAAASSQWPHLTLRYLHVPRANKNHALNEALNAVGSGLLIFFDDDVRIQANALEAYAAAAKGVSGGAYFGGPVAPDFEHRPAEWRMATLPASVRGWRQESEKDAWHLFLGANWAAFRSDILAVGGFDKDRGPGSPSGSTGQESDMQVRLTAAGVRRVYVPGALVWHYIPRERCSMSWALKRAYRTGTEKGILEGDAFAPGMGRPAFFVARTTLKTGLRLAKYGLKFDASGMWHALYHGVRSMGALNGYRIRRSRAV